jgi:hypothetical protein
MDNSLFFAFYLLQSMTWTKKVPVLDIPRQCLGNVLIALTVAVTVGHHLEQAKDQQKRPASGKEHAAAMVVAKNRKGAYKGP